MRKRIIHVIIFFVRGLIGLVWIIRLVWVSRLVVNLVIDPSFLI